MKLRKVPFAEKEAFYREKMGGPSEMKHMEDDGTIRALTEEEWNSWVKNAPHVDLHNDSPFDFNYQGQRKEFYPDANTQLGAIWKALDAIEQSGVDIGTSASAMLTKIKAIKAKYPKPANLEQYCTDNNLELDDVTNGEKPGES
tara:strand:- start:190 stop:621 length:432 start_codon:yes stop_codon:yes gene_type:complete